MRLALRLCVCLAALVATDARARDGRQQQVLVELAGVLGESHALRQACAGADDQFWRARMLRLLEIEQAPAGFEGELKAAFNDGFMARRRDFPACTPLARQAEAAAAARGRSLAGRLSQSVVGSAPETVAPTAPSR